MGILPYLARKFTPHRQREVAPVATEVTPLSQGSGSTWHGISPINDELILPRCRVLAYTLIKQARVLTPITVKAPHGTAS